MRIFKTNALLRHFLFLYCSPKINRYTHCPFDGISYICNTEDITKTFPNLNIFNIKMINKIGQKIFKSWVYLYKLFILFLVLVAPITFKLLLATSELK